VTPSPSPRLITPAPKRWAQRYDDAQREAHKAQVRAHALAAGHPSCAPYDHEAERGQIVGVLLALSLAEALRVRTMLDQSPHVDDHAIAATIRRQMAGRPDPDDTPPHGITRPGGVA
jgi:hypothetical protein